jgi:large subunit ribosomal protein L23
MGILNRFKKTKDEEQVKEEQSAVESQSTKKVEPAPVSTLVRVDSTDVIVKPLISEKSAMLAGANQYVFVVRKGANRLQVRAAIKQMYNVSPVSVNILNVRGKKVRFGRRQGKRSDWKKAIVTLDKGQSINVYEGV